MCSSYLDRYRSLTERIPRSDVSQGFSLFLRIGRLGNILGTTGMKILFVVLLVFSTAQENQGLDNKTNQNQNISKNETETKIDESTISRVKRYATHMNSFLRNFNFFNNDGKHVTIAEVIWFSDQNSLWPLMTSLLKSVASHFDSRFFRFRMSSNIEWKKAFLLSFKKRTKWVDMRNIGANMWYKNWLSQSPRWRRIDVFLSPTSKSFF